jgi:hypothetical protein
MSKNDQQSTNKRKSKSVEASLPKNRVRAEGVSDNSADKPEKSNPEPKTKLKAKKPKQKEISETIKSEVNEAEVNKSEFEHPTSEITEMEVHHHPQLDHKPKPWKEYLLEGFMIFIAVMMGFIAENIRENITNNEHVKQLTSQLVHDLRADTAQLNYIYQNESLIIKYNDTLSSLLQQPLGNADTRRIQKLAANSHSMWPFHPSMGAIAAIKNELHLKQFSDSEIINHFSEYERDIELLHTTQDVNLQYQRIYLDPFLTAHLTPANMDAAFSSTAVPTAKMRNLTQADLDQLATDMTLIRIISHEMLIDNRRLKNDAVKLLKYVTEQYNLEGE